MPPYRLIKLSDTFSVWVGGPLLLVIGLVCVIVGGLLGSARTGELQRASTEVSNLSAAINQDLARNIELYDLSVQGVIEGLQNPAVMAATPDLRQLILFDRAATAPYLGAIFVLDSAGRVIAASTSVAPRPVNYADREYFQVHKRRSDVGLYISKPLVSRSDGHRIIGLSRRVNNPDGSFGGIVVGTLRLDYIHNLFSRMRLGDGGALTLFRDDATVMMREPFDAAKIGMVAKSPILFKMLQSKPEGEFEATSAIDGVERLIHYSRIGALPLIQVVGMSIEDVYADWWRKVYAIAVVILLCCSIIAALAFALRRELQRRNEAEAALSLLAKQDSLTGIANRRRFDEILESEWKTAFRNQTPLSLLMIDADHFKVYNDTFGHLAGDSALAAIGGALRTRVRRTSDFVARYGGEEFAVILPRLSGQAAFDVADALRRDVFNLALSDPDDGYRISISVGVGCMTPRPGLSPMDLVAEADAALYLSKTKGRNRSTVRTTETNDGWAA